MCCLFGVFNYSGAKNPGIDEIVNNLAQEATIRGMDSTGIAYNKNGKMIVYKKPKNAYELDFKGLEDCCCVMGHTRHATQGSYKKNYNNHPFYGNCQNTRFALAHNGVLWNDTFLKKKFDLPHNKIETDSFVAVQLLEHFNTLSVENIAQMAELVQGSFTFTIMNKWDDLFIVKGDNPISIIHFPQLHLYVYASTTQILLTALCRTDLADDIASGDFEMLTVKSGDIVQITERGQVITNRFDYDEYGGWGYNWQTYNSGNTTATNTPYSYDNWDEYEKEYDKQVLTDLKAVARGMGFEDEDIDMLYRDGYTVDEIEDFIYSFYPSALR